MSCNECRDDRNTRAIRDIAVAVLLICWAVWMLIDDVQSLKTSRDRMRQRISALEDSLVFAHERIGSVVRDNMLSERNHIQEVETEEEVDLNG